MTFNSGSTSAPTSENYCAPFRFINGVDIHDLNLAGTIHTGRQFAAGITGHATGSNTIADCRISTSIVSHRCRRRRMAVDALRRL